MIGLNTKTGQRNVSYVPKVKAGPVMQPQQQPSFSGNYRKDGYALQSDNPKATNPYGDIAVMGNSQTQNMFNQFMQRREQRQAQTQAQSGPSVSFAGQQVNASDYGQPQLQVINDGNGSSALLRQGARPQGVQQVAPNKTINYGTTNYGTTQKFNQQTRQWETIALTPQYRRDSAQQAAPQSSYNSGTSNQEYIPYNNDGRDQYANDAGDLYNRSKNDMLQMGHNALVGQMLADDHRTQNQIKLTRETRPDTYLQDYNNRQQAAAASSRQANAQYQSAAEAAEAQKEAARQSARASIAGSQAGLLGSVFSASGNAQGWRYW